MTRRWPHRLVAAGGVALLAGEALPWWMVVLRETMIKGADDYHITSAAVWNVYPGGGIAVLLAVGAVAAWLASVRWLGSVSIWLRLGLAALVAWSLVSIVQWRRGIAPGDLPGGVSISMDDSTQSTVVEQLGRITRDHLQIYHVDGVCMDVGPGFIVAAVAMAIVCVAMLLPPGRVPPPSGPRCPTDEETDTGM